MTYHANYNRLNFHHIPWHSDIRTSNQLNTSPGQLSRPFQMTNSNRMRRTTNQISCISSKQTCPINLPSDFNPNSISNSNSDTIPASISEHTEAISKAISNSNPKTISESNHNHSHRRVLLQAGRLRHWLWEPVGEHLSSQYVAQVDLFISSHICSNIVLGCNECNCSSTVHSVLDARDQWLWIGEHVRDSWGAERIQEMRDLCESHAVYSEHVVFGNGRGLGSRLLFSWSAGDCSSEGDKQSTCPFIVMQASSIVRIDIIPKCAFSFSSECTFSKCSSECSSETQSPVLRAVEPRKHAVEFYHILIARVMIVPAENSKSVRDIRLRGNHHVHQVSNHRSVYGQIAGSFVGLPYV